jgi:hypothetical protein
VKKPITAEAGELQEARSPPAQPKVISVSAQDSLDGQRLPSADDSKVTQTEDHHQSEQLDSREPSEVGMRSTVDAPDRWDPMRHEAGAFYPPRGPCWLGSHRGLRSRWHCWAGPPQPLLAGA